MAPVGPSEPPPGRPFLLDPARDASPAAVAPRRLAAGSVDDALPGADHAVTESAVVSGTYQTLYKSTTLTWRICLDLAVEHKLYLCDTSI